MKRNAFLILIIVMLVSGLGFLLYPTVSNWISMNFRELEIANYSEAVEQMDPELAAAELEKAKAYNDALTGAYIEDPFIPGSGSVLPEGYASVLNIDGIIGYINIPKINVHLPVKHGTSNEVLQTSVGHLQNTAFPIGGEGNHTVLTSHTGLSSAKLFTDLAELEKGDMFYITVLNQTLAYEVDQILVVEPDDTEELRPVAGEDYATLVTCTPYSINSHRLFVRGTRIPYTEEEPPGGTVRIADWRAVIIAACVILFVLIFTVRIFIRRRNMQSE